MDDAFGIGDVDPVQDKKRNSKEFDLLNFGMMNGNKTEPTDNGNKQNRLQPKENTSAPRSNSMRGTAASLFDDFDFTSDGGGPKANGVQQTPTHQPQQVQQGPPMNAAANHFGDLFGDFSSDKTLSGISSHSKTDIIAPSSPKKLDVKSVMQGAYQNSNKQLTKPAGQSKAKPKKAEALFADLFD